MVDLDGESMKHFHELMLNVWTMNEKIVLKTKIFI